MELTPQEQQEMQEHIRGISKILYRNTPSEKIQTFEGIETTVRAYMQTELSPDIAEFFFQKSVK